MIIHKPQQEFYVVYEFHTDYYSMSFEPWHLNNVWIGNGYYTSCRSITTE